MDHSEMNQLNTNQTIAKNIPDWVIWLLLVLSVFCCLSYVMWSSTESVVGMLFSGIGGLLLGAGIAAWDRRKLSKRIAQEIQEIQRIRRQEIADLQSASIAKIEKLRLQKWFGKMRPALWSKASPEVEVEVKFIFQLLQYLGYEENEMELRTSIPVQEGSKQTSIEADWVVRDERHRALIVLEAKAPHKPLTEDVKEQARSYAFRLGAPVYIITNGLSLQIFHLGVVRDRCVLSCNTSRLRENWEAIQKAASKSNVTSLRGQLGE